MGPLFNFQLIDGELMERRKRKLWKIDEDIFKILIFSKSDENLNISKSDENLDILEIWWKYWYFPKVPIWWKDTFQILLIPMASLNYSFVFSFLHLESKHRAAVSFYSQKLQFQEIFPLEGWNQTNHDVCSFAK